jgi:hypothetical protein
MSDRLEVYEVGTNVMLTDDIEATIITIAIHHGDTIQYECAWWNGLTRTRDWFDASDFSAIGKKTKTKSIGFMRA